MIHIAVGYSCGDFSLGWEVTWLLCRVRFAVKYRNSATLSQ